MASSAEVAKRRHQVGELWVRGVPTLRIATTLAVPERTIRADIDVVRDQLQRDRLAELEARRDRSVAVFRRVQTEAWTLFSRCADNSTNKTGALNSIISAEERIAKLEGTLGADIKIDSTTNVTLLTNEEWQRIQQTIACALMPYQEARIAVATALAKMETRV